MTSSERTKRFLQGVVVSDKMDKTLVVQVERRYKHPLFGKIMRTTKKYKVHDEEKRAKLGDVVKFYEGRPVSKTKYMYLAQIMNSKV